MSLFSKKDKLPYKIKLVERIQYLAGSAEAQEDLRKLEERKNEFIEEAKTQLIEQSQKKIALLTRYKTMLTEKEKDLLVQTIKNNPFFDIDKDLQIPYINIRKAIRRAHAY